MIINLLVVTFLTTSALGCQGGNYGDGQTTETLESSKMPDTPDISEMPETPFDTAHITTTKTNMVWGKYISNEEKQAVLNIFMNSLNNNGHGHGSTTKNWKDNFNDYYNDDDDDDEGSDQIHKTKDPLEKIMVNGWQGWTPPPDTHQEWSEWINDYNTENNKTNIDFLDPNNPHEFDDERRPGSGFPNDWLGLGAGHKGAGPPPWAYVPKQTGKPMRCSLPLKVGKECPDVQSEIRYAYNQYMDKCVEFQYKGCGGNINNFRTMLSCEQKCMTPTPFGGCDRDSHIKVEDIMDVLD